MWRERKHKKLDYSPERLRRSEAMSDIALGEDLTPGLHNQYQDL